MTEASSIALDADALKYVLSHPKGRALIWDLLAAYGLFRNAHDAIPADRDFKLGMHNAALILYSESMAVSPDLTALMIREQGNYDNDDAGTEPRKPAVERDPNSLGLARGHVTDLGGSDD